MNFTRPLTAALLSTVFAAGAAFAQAANGDNPAPAGVDCLKDSPQAMTSGTSSSKPLKSMRSNGRSLSVARGSGGIYSQCTAKRDRSERAECVRTVYERRYGNSDTSVASSSNRAPC